MSDQANDLATTPLHDIHQALGARMMPFGGFQMPVQYTGIIDEHKAVRTAAGLFDVSHMGEVSVSGPNARTFVQQLVTNDVNRLHPGRAMYTVMCRETGGIVDDLLVYMIAEDEFLLVINAANTAKDIAWMQDHNPMGAQLTDISKDLALLALQGPKALKVARTVTDLPVDELKYYHFLQAAPGEFLGCEKAILSATGYTGEPGLEIYCEAKQAPYVWNQLMEAGADLGLQPAGLGARDTLRIEAGYCLYGSDITDETNPYEAGLSWLVKPEKESFVGKKALQEIAASGPSRQLVAFVLEARGIPRSGYQILDADGQSIGTVTSGTQSPTLNQGVGMGYVPNKTTYTSPGASLAIRVRNKQIKATVKKPPLHKESS